MHALIAAITTLCKKIGEVWSSSTRVEIEILATAWQTANTDGLRDTA